MVSIYIPDSIVPTLAIYIVHVDIIYIVDGVNRHPWWHCPNISNIYSTCRYNISITDADVAMIRNNAVWIHGLIKHCSKLNSRTDISPFLRLCSRNDPARPEKTCHSDVTCSAMHVAIGIIYMIPRSKLLKYCHGQLRQLSRMSIRSRIGSTVSFSKWRTSVRTQHNIFPTSEPQGFHAKYCTIIHISLRILGSSLSAMVLIYFAYVNIPEHPALSQH